MVKRGAKRRKFDSLILANLVDIRMRYQTPWKELPEKYMELLPPNSNETSPDWRTLKKAVSDEVGEHLVPPRVMSSMRTYIEEQYEQADIGSMLLTVLIQMYREWNLLHSKKMRHAISTGVRDTSEEQTHVPKFTKADQKRMDDLQEKFTAHSFKLLDLIRKIPAADNILNQFLTGSQPKVIEGEVMDKIDEPNINELVSGMMEGVQEQTAKMLSGITERHKEAGVGIYRPASRKRGYRVW